MDESIIHLNGESPFSLSNEKAQVETALRGPPELINSFRIFTNLSFIELQAQIIFN